MGILLRVLSNNFPMNTNMTGFKLFSCALDKSSLSIGSVKLGLTLDFKTEDQVGIYEILGVKSQLSNS